MLVSAEILEKRKSGKPYYVLNDSMLDFWFRYVNRATSLVNAGNGKAYYYSNVKDHLHDFMGKIFEKMAKEYLMMHAGQNGLPLLTEISDYQDTVLDENKKPRQIEIDLLGRNGNRILLVGECKFRHTPFDKPELEKMMDKIRYLPVSNPTVCVFSLSEYTDYVKKNADGFRLISIDEMYP